jgi:hypothetical protein
MIASEILMLKMINSISNELIILPSHMSIAKKAIFIRISYLKYLIRIFKCCVEIYSICKPGYYFHPNKKDIMDN